MKTAREQAYEHSELCGLSYDQVTEIATPDYKPGAFSGFLSTQLAGKRRERYEFDVSHGLYMAAENVMGVDRRTLMDREKIWVLKDASKFVRQLGDELEGQGSYLAGTAAAAIQYRMSHACNRGDLPTYIGLLNAAGDSPTIAGNMRMDYLSIFMSPHVRNSHSYAQHDFSRSCMPYVLHTLARHPEWMTEDLVGVVGAWTRERLHEQETRLLAVTAATAHGSPRLGSVVRRMQKAAHAYQSSLIFTAMPSCLSVTAGQKDMTVTSSIPVVPAGRPAAEWAELCTRNYPPSVNDRFYSHELPYVVQHLGRCAAGSSPESDVARSALKGMWEVLAGNPAVRPRTKARLVKAACEADPASQAPVYHPFFTSTAGSCIPAA